MSRHLLAATVLAGAAVIILAGCSASGSAGTPQVSQWDGPGAATSAGPAAPASGAAQGARSGGARSGGARSGSGARSGAGSVSGATSTSNSYVAPRSVSFPVTVGDTWVYQTTASTSTSTSTETGQITDKITSSEPATAGYQVMMSETSTVGGSATYAEPVYVFYPNGTVGYPVPDANGVSVEGNGVTWPDAADLASGRAYHSVVRILVDKAGAIEAQNADVTVQGAGTTAVTVPAGTYRALVVNTTLTTQKDHVTTTVQVKTWLAANTGPVKSVVVTHVGGRSVLTTTSLLLSFGPGVSRADGS